MRFLVTLTLLFNVCFGATIYYVKVSGNSPLGTDTATAWNYNTFKTARLVPGDVVRFKRGETYPAPFPIINGGPSNVTYETWGTGANPIISGFTTLSNWTLSSGSIYYATLEASDIINGVTVDGIVKAKGRTPNTGYLNYESHTANTSITDNNLSGTPSLVGAELVIRKYRYITDRHIVTAHAGGKLSYSATNYFGINNNYEPVDGNGFFIQGHLSTLDTEGEWYFDAVARRLYMHFGKSKPTSRIVRASTVDKLLSSNMSSYVTFNNIDFQGGNNAFYNTGSSFITFNNCNFVQQGRDAFYGAYCNNININGGSIISPLNNGMFYEIDCNNIRLSNVTISSCGTIAGMGASGDGSYSAIAINGDGNTITNCSIKNSGYNAINFSGDNYLITQNLIDTFCVIKDDGAGIYTINSQNRNITNVVISKNIVLNAIGAFAGVESYYYEAYGKAAGIYLDEHTTRTIVESNTVANGNWCGIFLNSTSTSNTIKSNTVYNHLYQMVFYERAVGGIRENTVTNNKFIAKIATQKTMFVAMAVADNPGLFANFSDNYYARPIDDVSTIAVSREYTGGGLSNVTLAAWKSLSGQDANSKQSLITIDNLKKIRLDYNYSAATSVVSLNSNNWKDVAGTAYSNTVQIAPYSGAVLCQSSGGGSAKVDDPFIKSQTVGINSRYLSLTLPRRQQVIFGANL